MSPSESLAKKDFITIISTNQNLRIRLISPSVFHGTYGKIARNPARHHRQCYYGGWR